MPTLHLRYLKTSSLPGLLLFLYISAFTFYFYLFCNAAVQKVDVQKSTLKKTPFVKKLNHSSEKHLKASLKIGDLQKSRLQKPASTQKLLKYTLQKIAYSKKHSTYCIKAFKSSKNILKSFQKHEKALVKHSVNLLLSMFVSLSMSILSNLSIPSIFIQSSFNLFKSI